MTSLEVLFTATFIVIFGCVVLYLFSIVWNKNEDSEINVFSTIAVVAMMFLFAAVVISVVFRWFNS